MTAKTSILCCFSIILMSTLTGAINNGHEDVKASDLIYTLYTRNDTKGVNITLEDIDVLNSTAFDGRFKYTFFIVFGLENPSGIDRYQIKDQILAKADVNIFVVNWRKLAETNRLTEDMIITLGDYMTEFLFRVGETYRIFFIKTNFIASSLAAHAAGIVGSKVNNLINQIEALDPALIIPQNPTKYVNQTVTHYLKVTHTNGGMYGIGQSFGHVDYYPNGGAVQAGCETDMCSHDRALAYFAESILNNKFLSRKCTDYQTYTQGLCDDAAISYMGGIFPRTRTYGVYFLDTNTEPPYGRG